MAKINRFYLLISMLVSYRIGTVMANTATNTYLWLPPQNKYLARPADANDAEGCHICVPIIGLHSGGWQGEAVEWVDQHEIQLTETEDQRTICWPNRYSSNTLYSVGSKANYANGSGTEFLVCTPNGWKVADDSPGRLSETQCNSIDNKCANRRDTSSNQHNMQSYADSLEEDGLGSDYTSATWQVCLFGKSNNLCLTETKCERGYYGWGDGNCEQCPSPSSYYIAKQSGSTFIKGGYITAMSDGSYGQSTCYVPGSDNYWDTSGVFYFSANCYY